MAVDADSVFAPLVAAAKRMGLSDFLSWWRCELLAILPVGWRERLSSRDTAYLCADGDEWSAFRTQAGRLAQSGRVNIGTLDFAGRRLAFRRLLAEEPGAAGNVWLVLPNEAVLLREVQMPMAAEEALRDAVGFDLDRLTPLPAERAWFDFRVTGRNVDLQRLTLTLAVTARAPVEARLAELRELGAAVLGVGVMNDVAGSLTPLNLLPSQERDRPATSASTIAARVLAIVVAVLAVAALAFPLYLKREAVIALGPRLEGAKSGAVVAERLAKEIEKLATAHNFILARKQAQQPAVSILEDLSRLLPDTTWVQQLDVKTNQKARELQIAGETGSSSQLIEVLERSGSLANAGFKSPLTKGVSPNTERFLLAAEVKPRPLPDPIPESTLLVAPSGDSSAMPATPPANGGVTQAPGTNTADTASAVQSPVKPGATGLSNSVPATNAAITPPVANPPATPAPGRASAKSAVPTTSPVAQSGPVNGTKPDAPPGKKGLP